MDIDQNLVMTLIVEHSLFILRKTVAPLSALREYRMAVVRTGYELRSVRRQNIIS